MKKGQGAKKIRTKPVLRVQRGGIFAGNAVIFIISRQRQNNEDLKDIGRQVFNYFIFLLGS